jgi:HlyD family secretion protein
MKRIRKIIIPLFVLAIVATTIAWRLRTDKEDPSGALTLYGNVEIRDAQLAFKDQERISTISVEEGDRVTPGQVLARLDTNRLQARIKEAEAGVEAQAAVVKRLDAGTRKEVVRQAYAQVAAAEVRYKNATQRLDRLKQTAAEGATSQQDLDDARAQVKVQKADLQADRQALDLALAGPRKEDIQEAKARLKARQQALDLLRIRYAEMTLRAPAAGIIRNRILEPGEMAGPNTPVLTLSLTDPKWVRAYIPEPDLGRIAPGMTAKVTCDSFPKTIFHGWIGFISPEAEFTPRSVETTDLRTKLVYEVRVYVKDPQNRLRLGVPVTVTVDRESTG